MSETRTKQLLFEVAKTNDISQELLIEKIRESGIVGKFDPEKWDDYMAVIHGITLEERRAALREKIHFVPAESKESLADKAVRALKAWGEVKWWFQPVVRTPDGRYVKDPDGTVEGELVYPGVPNE